MSITRTDQTLEHRHFRSPDEVRTFDNGRVDVTSLPSGHDAWVVGGDDVVVVDWFGATEYAL
jgi:hypothetical protein